ncbi:MAG: hypothetical protein NZL93_00210, partial [Chthoniobacterales bacterium]|nr:hypothetical protein [Chthoniobacterales bacterium]
RLTGNDSRSPKTDKKEFDVAQTLSQIASHKKLFGSFIKSKSGNRAHRPPAVKLSSGFVTATQEPYPPPIPNLFL